MMKFERLRDAVKNLYMAGRWSCDRPCDEAALWTEVRDAAGIEPGTATAAGVGVAPDRQSSDEVATLASNVLQLKLENVGPADQPEATMSVATLLSWAQTLAGSVLSQADGPESA